MNRREFLKLGLVGLITPLISRLDKRKTIDDINCGSARYLEIPDGGFTFTYDANTGGMITLDADGKLVSNHDPIVWYRKFRNEKYD